METFVPEMQYEYNEFGKLIMATVASISGDHYYFMDGRVETMEIEYPGKKISKVTYLDGNGNKLYCEEYECILMDTQ